MTRGELVEALARRDVHIPAQDKPRYIGTLIWRNKSKFVNIEGRGYWLRGQIAPNDELLLDATEVEPPMREFAPVTARAMERQRLEGELAEHKRRYFEEDAPTISDAEYDAKLGRLRELKG